MEKKIKLLLSYVYWKPVGHVVEALKFATGIYNANKNLEIHLILNDSSPAELADACSWIKKTYIVNLKEIRNKGDKAECLKSIPKQWDYVVSNKKGVEIETRRQNPSADEKDLLAYASLVNEIFHAKKGIGYVYYETWLPKNIKYQISKVIFKLPKKAKKFAKKYNYKKEKICIMLGGSAGYKYYPSIKSWIKIIQRINKEFPNCRIYLTGVRKSSKERTHTLAYTESNIKNIIKKFDNVINCYNIGLWNQLALIEKCNIFLSPHTGFGFLSSCVNTPWLTLSGGDWPEYLFNNHPFYCVLPDDKDYPYFGQGRFTKHKGGFSTKGGKIPSFEPKKFEKKIPEIIKAIHLLMEKDFDYRKAIKIQKKNILKSNCKQKELMSRTREKF